MIGKFKNLIERKFLRKFYSRKILSIGHSHLLNFRSKYKSILSLSELDYKIFSQNGEDGILDYLLYSLNITSPKFVEIGIGDYSESNTRFIFETTNCKGLLIDCNENLEKNVKKNIIFWKNDIKILQDFINSENIVEILKNNDFEKDLDLFSLDIDGIDYWVLKSMSDSFSKIVVVEFNSNFGHEIEVTVPNIKNFNRTKYHYSNLCFGASLKAIVKLMNSKKFTFIGTNKNCINAFFVSNNYLNNLNIKIPNQDNLKDFTESNIRESRLPTGDLNYLSGNEKIKEIYDCEVVDLSNIEIKTKKIKELF